MWCSYSRPIDSTTIYMACVTVKQLQTVRGGVGDLQAPTLVTESAPGIMRLAIFVISGLPARKQARNRYRNSRKQICFSWGLGPLVLAGGRAVPSYDIPGSREPFQPFTCRRLNAVQGCALLPGTPAPDSARTRRPFPAAPGLQPPCTRMPFRSSACSLSQGHDLDKMIGRRARWVCQHS